MGFSEPFDTVLMGHHTAAIRYTWQSAPLSDGRLYRFVVRIATAAHPVGMEAQDTDERAGTAGLEQPATPALAVQLV